MERIKVAALVVIAGALCLLVAERWMPVAHAETGEVRCGFWTINVNAATLDKQQAKVQEQLVPIREWLVQNPGEVVFRSSLPFNLNSYEILCVR
jgi:hypothetical protein